jgi:RNA polymerase sigma factor (sigma-70 family)
MRAENLVLSDKRTVKITSMNTEVKECQSRRSEQRRKAEKPPNMSSPSREEIAARDLSTGSPAGGANRFHTTRWSVVLLSAQSQVSGCKEAFAELCRLYWYPLYAFIRHRGHSPEDAQDLTQGFFLHLAERKALTRVDRSKGRFRSFLLASLQNHLSNEAQRARRLKRGGKAQIVYFDIEGAEDRYSMEPVEALTPEKIFDARWAMALLNEATKRLSREYLAQGKETTFEALKAFLDPINCKELPTYEDVADRLKISVGSVKTLIHRLRKQYTAFVREEISRTVSDPADVDAEIHQLCEALIAAEGWIMP